MNVESWFDEKNDLIDAETGLTERMMPGSRFSWSVEVIRSRATFSMRTKPRRSCDCEQLADRADALVLKVVDVVPVRLAVHVRHHLDEDRDAGPRR